MKRGIISTIALLAATLPQCYGGRPELLRVTAVRFWSLSEVTRVAVETTGEFQFHSERVHDPERVFFDIFRSRPWINGKRAYSVEVNDKRIKRIRVAETLPGITRIVFDLQGEAECSASVLANPERLMIEVRLREPEAAPTSPEAPPPVSAAPPPPAPAPDAAAAAPPPAAAPQAAETAAPKPAPAETAAAKPAPAVETAPSPKPAEVPPAKPALPTRDGSNSLVRALGLKVGRVVLDPGHGGHDQGTVGPKGLMEKDLVLDLAKRLGKLIEERMGAEVIYTRTDDTFVPLEGRTAFANENKADLFLSLHANSSKYSRIGGVETFYLNFTGAKDALEVAARENASSQKTIFELQDMLVKITRRDKAEESKEFATRMQEALQSFERRYNASAKNRGVKTAPFVVLIGANMPSILAEIGFLSNPKEEALLKRSDHRQKLAEALFQGLSRYAKGLSHFQVAQTK